MNNDDRSKMLHEAKMKADVKLKAFSGLNILLRVAERNDDPHAVALSKRLTAWIKAVTDQMISIERLLDKPKRKATELELASAYRALAVVAESATEALGAAYAAGARGELRAG